MGQGGGGMGMKWGGGQIGHSGVCQIQTAFPDLDQLGLALAPVDPQWQLAITIPLPRVRPTASENPPPPWNAAWPMLAPLH